MESDDASRLSAGFLKSEPRPGRVSSTEARCQPLVVRGVLSRSAIVSCLAYHGCFVVELKSEILARHPGLSEMQTQLVHTLMDGRLLHTLIRRFCLCNSHACSGKTTSERRIAVLNPQSEEAGLPDSGIVADGPADRDLRQSNSYCHVYSNELRKPIQ